MGEDGRAVVVVLDGDRGRTRQTTCDASGGSGGSWDGTQMIGLRRGGKGKADGIENDRTLYQAVSCEWFQCTNTEFDTIAVILFAVTLLPARGHTVENGVSSEKQSMNDQKDEGKFLTGPHPKKARNGEGRQ